LFTEEEIAILGNQGGRPVPQVMQKTIILLLHPLLGSSLLFPSSDNEQQQMRMQGNHGDNNNNNNNNRFRKHITENLKTAPNLPFLPSAPFANPLNPPKRLPPTSTSNYQSSSMNLQNNNSSNHRTRTNDKVQNVNQPPSFLTIIIPQLVLILIIQINKVFLHKLLLVQTTF
jgi:hypothetical protein